jgi:hypothetical protein
LPDSNDPFDLNAEREFHAACLRKVDDRWFVLDSAEDLPINLNNWLVVADWFKCIEYMEFFEMLPSKSHDRLVHK